MFTRIKTPNEIEAMRTSGKMLASILKKIKHEAVVGATGKDIAQFVRGELKALDAKASFLGQYGFPDVICISVNDEVVHGVPNNTPFKKGDLVSFDFGVTFNGMITDSAFTMAIEGTDDKEAQRLLKTTEESLYAGINQVHNGVRVGDIASAVQKVLEHQHLGVVRDLVGHGVGHQVHEDPNIPNYGVSGTGVALKEGMTIAIEPMATLGSYQVKPGTDNWAIRTADGSLSAHFEHTVLITAKGAEILTAL
ncbi:MAG TPA: type I methionyl aminopeptidase [Candidatus Acidoferrum sp.]|nr:type I methionyl aminopeptidase [Candidatus Acidoferrum sp.]